MAYEFILCEKQENFAVITLNRPKANALSKELMQELGHAVETLQDDASVRSVIITGGEGRFFSGGADLPSVLKELGDASSSGDGFIQTGLHTIRVIEGSSKPVIAAVNGVAVGGGCEITLACHLRIAADSASFGQPEVKLGIIPGWGGTHRLRRLVGESRAMDWLLTGRTVAAQEALDAGLVCKVVPQAELMDNAIEMAATIGNLPPVAIRMTLRSVLGSVVSPGIATDLEAECFAEAGRSKDAAEGIAAFLEKRAPKFIGE